MNQYQEKKQARIDRYKERAAKKLKESEERGNSQNIQTLMGMGGEPVKVGHHSEGRHRRLLERADRDMQKSYEASKAAEEYDRRAEAAANNKAVSSDDPEALAKLRAKLAHLEYRQEQMKRINAAYRKFVKNPDSIDGLKLTIAERDMVVMFKPEPWMQDVPFPSHRLVNNNAMIKTTDKRIQELEKKATAKTVEREYDGFSIVENVELNRVQIVLDSKPDEDTREWLRGHGFKWSPRNNAWQRFLNQAGKSMVRAFVARAEKGGES